MPSLGVDTPSLVSQRRRSRRIVDLRGDSSGNLDSGPMFEPFGEPPVEIDWDQLISADLPAATRAANSSSESTGAFRRATLPPGVIDTRPAGLRVVDVRDRGEVRDGVLDTRPHGLTGLAGATGSADLVETPASPFEAREVLGRADWFEAEPAPADPGELDVDTGEVRRVVERVEAVDVPAPPPADDMRVPADRRTGKEATSPYQRRSELRRLEARAARKPSAGSLSVPQVGIASALGLATIAAPLAGVLSAPVQVGVNQLSTKSSSALLARAPALAAAPFPLTVPAPSNAVEEVRVVVDDTRLSDVPGALVAPGRVLVTRASRGSNGRAVLPGCDGIASPSAQSAPNGRIPASALCTLWDRSQTLRADAAVSLARLNVAYKQTFGRDLCVTDSYRTISDQYAIKALRGGYAAAPGTSEHGNGVAIDLCGGGAVARTPTYTWLRANAQRYNWVNPDWAQNQLYEPWHWEYRPVGVAGEQQGQG